LSGTPIAGAVITFTINGVARQITVSSRDTITSLLANIADASGLNPARTGATLSFPSSGIAGVSGVTQLSAGVSYSGGVGEVYAIVPGFTGTLAPVDIAGYANPFDPSDPATRAVGQTITLTAPAGGLAAGNYLLLPGAYATLPGAYRVELA